MCTTCNFVPEISHALVSGAILFCAHQFEQFRQTLTDMKQCGCKHIFIDYGNVRTMLLIHKLKLEVSQHEQHFH